MEIMQQIFLVQWYKKIRKILNKICKLKNIEHKEIYGSNRRIESFMLLLYRIKFDFLDLPLV